MVSSTAAAANISGAVEAPPISPDDVGEGNVDYKGRPVNRSKSGRWRSASFIMGMRVAQGFAFYGIYSNLVNYLTGPLGQSTATAAENVNAWFGTASLLPLLGAFVADSFLGRYLTIVLSCLLYILGLAFMTISAVFTSSKSSECQNVANTVKCSPSEFQVSSPSEFQVIFFFSGLYLTAVADGAVTPCLQAFGADQFDGRDPEECKAKSTFFNWSYICGSGAITVSCVLLTYIQEYLSWGFGFGIPCLVLGFGVLFFLLGTSTYRFRVSTTEEMNPFLKICQVFLRVGRNWRITSSAICTKEESQGFLPHQLSQDSKFLNRALLVRNGSEQSRNTISSSTDVEEAKSISKLFPIWATCLVYGIVFSQAPTLFTKQGVTMDRSIIPSFQLPAASLQAIGGVCAVVSIVIYDRVLVPIARSITKRPSGITMLQRVGTGIFVSVLLMVIAALVEMKRLEIAKKYELVQEPVAAIPMSVLWLIPQHLILGVSAAFVMVGLQEFFYDQVPNQLKSTGIALHTSIFGLGSFLSSFLINVIDRATSKYGNESWFSDNLNKAHLDYFYWLLAGLNAVALTAYLFLAKSYVYNGRGSVSVTT